MGADHFHHVVRYQKNVQRALDQLRLKVFRSGEYDGAGDGAESPDEALDGAPAETGTRSILDIQFLSSRPELGAASEVTGAELVRLVGTDTPTVEQLEASNAFWESIGRGEARYVVIREGGKPVRLSERREQCHPGTTWQRQHREERWRFA